MKSFQLGKFWGIPVKIHWTFSLLFLLILGIGWFNSTDAITLLSFGLFIITMFTCVVLHEYGHALTARKFGVDTLDIIISPIGGIARLTRLPENPKHELWVAIAGPLVNLSIAFLLLIIAAFTFDFDSFVTPDESIEIITTVQGFMILLIWINTVLFVFNLVPAFPMDGGRILRAFLSMRYGKVKGTKYASIVGRLLAVVFVGLGFFYSITLVFIGVFVFIMAKSENEQVLLRSKLSGVLAYQIVNTHFTKLHLSTSMREVYEMFIRGGERNYVVFDSMENVSGVLPELFIKEAIKTDNLDVPVGQMMSNTIYYAPPTITLDLLFEEMNAKGAAIAIIKNDDQLLGVIDRHMLQNYIKLQLGN